MRSPVALPPAAQDILNSLELARDSALDAGHSAASRLSGLPRDASAGQRERLSAERDRHAERHRVLAQIVSRINQFRTELAAGVVLEPAPAVEIKLKSGETPSDAVERLRGEISAIRQQLQATRSAPLPLADQKQLIAQSVLERAQSGRPRVVVADDAARIAFRENIPVTSLLCWLMPDVMTAALSAELIERAGAMPADERTRKVAELEALLLAAERSEAALIERARETGIEVLPRVDMDVRAFLGVNVATANHVAVERVA